MKDKSTTNLREPQARRAAEACCRLILDNVADVICQFDPVSGEVSYVSPSVRNLIGYGPGEVLEKTIGELIHPASRRNALARVRSHIARFRDQTAGESSQQDEYFLGCKDGSILAVEARSTCVRNMSGNINIIAVVRDIQGRKEIENEVLRRIEMEQERIGRDLHDSLCQVLIASKFRCALLARKLHEQDLLWAAAELKGIEESLGQTVEQARDLGKGLNPVHLESNGLACALSDLAGFIEISGDVTCDFKISEQTSVPTGEVARHLYRITQEAVQNALKHGQAKNISIILRQGADEQSLIIVDDGLGLADDFKNSSGSGLHNMMARAALIGGTFTLRRGAYNGAVVRVKVPILQTQKKSPMVRRHGEPDSPPPDSRPPRT